MSHGFEKDKSGKHPFAYVGDATWHGLGQHLSPGQPIPVWIEEAGFDWEIKEATAAGVEADNGIIMFPEKKLLYRSDTRQPLSIVGSGYRIVQPAEVLQFYEDLVALGGFSLETAGILFNGKRFFALAKVADGQEVVSGDMVKGYLLLSSSCDGSLATTAQFTSVRVVCNNTLGMAIREKDGEERPRIKIPHSAEFSPKRVKEQLGLAQGSFASFMEDMRRLAGRRLNNHESVMFLVGLFGDPTESLENQEPKDANLMKQVHRLYSGDGTGSGLAGKTAWGMMNAVTEYCDHLTGHKTDDARIDSAWFGQNANLKQKAYEQLMLMTA